MTSWAWRDLPRKRALRTRERGHGGSWGAAGDGRERLREVGRGGGGRAGWSWEALGAMPLPPLPGWQLPRVRLVPVASCRTRWEGANPKPRGKVLALGLYKALPGRMVSLLGEFLDFSKQVLKSESQP